MFSQLNSRKELEIPFYIFYLQINLRLQIHVFRVVSFFKTKTLTLRKMHLGAVEIMDFVSARTIPGRILCGTLPSGDTESCEGNKRGATASRHNKTRRGSHESGRFYRGAIAATDRHRQLAALLFVAVSRNSTM